MKILVIDRDNLATQLIRSKLETLGHQVVEQAVKNDALALLDTETFDSVFFDPAPLNSGRPIVLGVRRAVANYPYVIIMSHDIQRDDALKSGANELLAKPFDAASIEEMMGNAQRLTRLISRIGDESEDFPSAGGVIAKSAFNQLFLSCLDRADRYAERSFMVFIAIENYEDLIAKDGAYAAEYASAKLSQYLVRLRRQSDIIAQTGKGEYCLLLQRPTYETEPMEAASRFADALHNIEDICATDNAEIQISIRLIDVPVGQLHSKHIIDFSQNKVIKAL